MAAERNDLIKSSATREIRDIKGSGMTKEKRIDDLLGSVKEK